MPTVQAIVELEPFRKGWPNPSTAVTAPPPFDVPLPKITPRTPGQRRKRIWLRPFYCPGAVVRLKDLEAEYIRLRHTVVRCSDGWMSLRMTTKPMELEYDASANTTGAKPAGANDWVWVAPFWSGGFAVETEALCTGVLYVPLRVRVSDSGMVTMVHCMDPRREYFRRESTFLSEVKPFSDTGPKGKWECSATWELADHLQSQRTLPGVKLWDDSPSDDGPDPYACCACCHDRSDEEYYDDGF